MIYLLLLARMGHGQGLELAFQALGKDEGLVYDQYNFYKSQDSRGFVWIGSMEGCFRFDGMQLKHYWIKTHDHQSEFDQHVQSPFFEDDDSNLWFSTYSALHKYNRELDSFESYQLSMGKEKLKDWYRVFYLDRANNVLWLRAGDYICNFNIHTKEYQFLEDSTQGIHFAVDTFSTGYVNTIISCPWYNKRGVEIYKRDSINGHWHKKEVLKEFDKVVNSYISENGSTYLSNGSGLLLYNHKEGKLVKNFIPDGSKKFECIGLAAQEGTQTLFVTARNAGLWQFDIRRNAFVRNWIPNAFNSRTLKTDSPTQLYIDHDQRLWITHDFAGLDYTVKSGACGFGDPINSLLDSPFTLVGIIEDLRRNQIWVQTQRHGIFRFTLEGELLGWSSLNASAGEKSRQISIDKEGNIWTVGDYNIYKLSVGVNPPSTEEWENIFHSKERLYSMFITQNNYKFLITTKGVFPLVGDGEKYYIGETSIFPDASPNTLEQFYQCGDKDQVIIPFNENEIWIAKSDSSKITIVEKIEINSRINNVLAMSSYEKTLIATDRGIATLDSENKVEFLDKYFEYGVSNMIQASEEKLWISTIKGLDLFEPTSGRISHYTIKDGIKSDNFLKGIGIQASDGKIWLGNDKGLTVFHPDSIKINTVIPKPHIEKLWINHVPFTPQIAISETDTLVLNYRQNTLDFELRAVGFEQAKACKLSYRLLEYDSSWVDVENGSFAKFTKIPPGKYLLEILAINANGLKGNIKRLSIYITPPFWQTLWFQLVTSLFILVLMSLIVGSFYRRKLKKTRELLEKQKAVAAERQRISGELHDDLSGNLTSILFLSEDLANEIEEPKNDLSSLWRIRTLANKSLDNMRMIVWALDTKRNTVKDLATYLRTDCVALLTDHKIPVELSFPNKITPNARLRGEIRKNIVFIARESLHNIVKHAQATQVKIQFKIQPKMLVLAIEDNGKGFISNSSQSTGNGLFNMRERARSVGASLKIDSHLGVGTKLILEIPVEL